jgi:hypothetical protein
MPLMPLTMPMQCLGIVKATAEVNPGHPPQEIRQRAFVWHWRVGEQDWNNTKGRVPRALV